VFSLQTMERRLEHNRKISFWQSVKHMQNKSSACVSTGQLFLNLFTCYILQLKSTITFEYPFFVMADKVSPLSYHLLFFNIGYTPLIS